MITGVRQGESAIRDQRIEMSCSKDGAECGQGWYQKVLPEAKGLRGRLATLAPLLHWRVCHVWEWLRHWAPGAEFGDWSTAAIAEAYGGDEAEEINARTGCTGCPLVDTDMALDNILLNPQSATSESRAPEADRRAAHSGPAAIAQAGQATGLDLGAERGGGKEGSGRSTARRGSDLGVQVVGTRPCGWF